MTLDRKECDHLIGAVAAELADTAPNPMVPEDWGRGWDAALKEHAEPLAEQLNAALAEIDALTERQQKHLQLIANLSQSTPLPKSWQDGKASARC